MWSVKVSPISVLQQKESKKWHNHVIAKVRILLEVGLISFRAFMNNDIPYCGYIGKCNTGKGKCMFQTIENPGCMLAVGLACPVSKKLFTHRRLGIAWREAQIASMWWRRRIYQVWRLCSWVEGMYGFAVALYGGMTERSSHSEPHMAPSLDTLLNKSSVSKHQCFW